MKTNSPPFGPRTFLSALAAPQPHRRTKLSTLLMLAVLSGLLVVLYPLSSALAVTFPGNARVEVTDPNGGLSWSNNVGAQALTVQCWFKLSIPSGISLTENMTILVNRTNGSTSDKHAYHLWYDKAARNIQFSTRGTNVNPIAVVVIAKPYLDRWYHVALVRSGNNLTAYVDGTVVPAINNLPINAGDARSTYGVSIGGWGNSKYLYGEVQEVAIYQTVLGAAQVFERLFTDQRDRENLYGYYKLGYSTNSDEHLRNFANNQPPGTDPALKAGTGQIIFEETNQKGEQSLFDSQVSGGKNAVVPLSGAFAWQHSVFRRPVPGVPFDFTIGYSPAGGDNNLGPGWNHSLSPRVISEGSTKEYKLLTWQGGIETYDRIDTASPFATRHGEYRGELTALVSTEVEWNTPQRIIYRFLEPGNPAQSTMAGRLVEIRDFNTNWLALQWNPSEGYITNIVDSTGGNYRFSYNAQKLLTNLAYGTWQVFFTYSNVAGADRLFTKTLTNTSGIYSNLSTTLRFYYNTNGLLERIVDARGHTNVLVRYDDFGRQIETVNALGHATRRAYGVPGKRQITTTDAEGFQWVETYDRKGRVTARKDPLGHENRSTYDEHGNQVAAIDPRGNLTLFAYDDRANVVAQTNALGEVSRRTYHGFFNKPLTETDALGWTTTNSYDANGNLRSRRDALGTLASYTYTTNGLVATQTDANGRTNWFAYNTNGFRVAETDAAGFTKRFLPNALGWNLAITNALGEVTAYAFDLNGNTVRTVDPLGRVYAGTFDPNGNMLTQTDPKGQQARYTYDALNRRTMEVNRAGATNWFAYTPRGKQLAVTNALGHATVHQYDAANRETNAVDALANSVRTEYDANGNAVALIDPLGQRWTKTLDRLNRPVAVSDPFGNTTRTLFDAAGRVRESIAADGSSTTHRYDARGRMTHRVDAMRSVWRYDYDGVGNLTNITDALGGHYVMVYSNRNERILERNQDGKEWRYTYDALSRLKTQHQPNGNAENIEYDTGGRIVSVNFSTGRVNSFLYDDNDNPVVLSRSGSGPATISQIAYDAMDRVQQCTDAYYKTIRYDYDRAGRLTGRTYPDGKTLTNRYDALDRLTEQVFQFSAQQAFTNTYAYDKAGRVIRRSYPNGIVQTNGFDPAGRLTGLSHAPLSPQPAKLNIALGFAYDRNGNTIHSTAQGTFQWPMPALRQEQGHYTAAGRLIDRNITLTGSTNPQPSVLTYHYDDSGNMTNAVGNGQSWSLTYDEDNRTTSICWTNGGLNDVAITNRYDALGRRISRTADGTQTGYVLDLAGDMERILCDLDAARNITAYYIHGFDLTFKISPDGSLTCYHADAQGNIIALTDAQADTVAEYAYTPYGRSLGSITYSAPVSNPYLFVGSRGVMEELPGLYFMRARYYSAEAGVFLSTDPVKNIGASWLPLAFVYAECNPLRFNDPNGEFINWIVAGVAAVVGAVVNATVEVVTQLIENGGNFSDIQWGQVGIAAGIGFIQGGIAGLTMGASVVAQVIAGAVVGGATSLLQTGLSNLTEGKAFVENWQSAALDVGTGMAFGAAGAKYGAARAFKAKPPPLLRMKSFRGLPTPEKPPLLRLKSFRGLPKGALDPDTPQISNWDELGNAFREAAGWEAAGEFIMGVGSGLFADALKQFAGASQSYEYWK